MKLPRYSASMKVVRRIHMYLGLLMYPWVLMYGLSGMLFNHPQIGRDLERRGLPAERFTELTGFSPWQPGAVAHAVVTALNRDGNRYQLEGEPKLVGFPIFVSPSPDGGRDMLIMSLTAGRAGIGHHPPSDDPPPAPFAGPVDVPRYTMGAIEARLAGLKDTLRLPGPPFKTHPKVGPELHLQLRDGNRRWNAVYDLRTGSVSGRRGDQPSALSLVELLGKLHTQHHFPVHWGASGYWAIFADLTGLCLMLWALSGLFMWWQIKPSRRWGALAIALSLALAAAVMTGMGNELTFLPTPASGP